MSKILNLKQDCFGDLELKFGVYLGFVIWDLKHRSESQGEQNEFGPSISRDIA
jgi:hypothetical protein